MSESEEKAIDLPTLEEVAIQRAQQALRLASASVPHLSGLARLARLKAHPGVSVAAVTASGLVLLQPQLFATMPLGDAAYILAHELMHLALDTHGRQGRADRLLANFAHDYIINDILSEEMGREPPLGGLAMEGARTKAFEEVMVELSCDDSQGPSRCWSPDASQSGKFPGAKPSDAPSPMTRALADAGLVERPKPPPAPQIDDELRRGDVIPSDRESDFEPELDNNARRQRTSQIRRAAAKAASLAELRDKLNTAQAAPTKQAGQSERSEALIEALRGAYNTPWQLALQRWMDAVAPGDRTYARPSRRGADRTDIVLPGRRREGWTLHIVLDTSGSMVDYLPHALGAIAYFCESTGVADIHVVQCDEQVTRDEWVDAQELAEYSIVGFGYSDMTPAMVHLAEDSEVTAVLVLTDGYIGYPEEPPPYQTLWVLLGDLDPTFQPDYGQVVRLV